jgi:WD40 repeat protein
MKKFFVLFAFLFSALAVQSQYPVVGDWSDTLWMRGSNDPHYSVVFDPNSQYVAGPTFGVGIEILSVKDGQRVKAYSGGAPYFLRKGKLLTYVYGDWKYEVRIVDFETDSIIFKKSWENPLVGPSFAISPDERTIAIGAGDRIDLYDIETGQLLRSRTDIKEKNLPGATYIYVPTMLFLPNGKEILFKVEGRYIEPKATWTETRHLIWDIERDSLALSGWWFPISITPDGTKMAYVGGGPGRLATVIDLKTNEEVGYVPIPPPPMDTIMNCVNDLSISPDGKYVLYAICEWSGQYFPYRIGIWDIEMNQLVYICPRNLAGYSCAFSPNGKYFAIGYSIFLFDFERIKRKIEMASGVYTPKARDEFFVYYNPAQVDYIRIVYPMEEVVPTILTIYDMYGNIVVKEECGMIFHKYRAYSIPLYELSSGIYFVTIDSKGKRTTQKFVVTH